MRLPKRKAVTIAAGYYFNGGIILCADTQETVGIAKTWSPKLIVEPNENIGKDSRDDLMIAVAGSGDGPMIDKLVERAWKDVKDAPTFEDACIRMELSIEATYEHYGKIFQAGYVPSAQLVYGVKMQGQSKLFGAEGPIVNEKRGYASVGAGYYMADFLASRMHQRFLPGPQVLLLAAYTIFQCKEHVDGCGGDTHIAVLHDTGRCIRLDPWRTDFWTDQLNRVDQIISTLLLSAADYSTTTENFKKELDVAMAAIVRVHADGEQFSKDWKKYTETSFRAMGFPKQSASGTSEPEQ